MSEEHIKGCGALRCRHVLYTDPTSREVDEDFNLVNRVWCEETEERHVALDHAFKKGTCSCIVGELRAEIERLEKENARLKEQMLMNEDWLKE